MSRTDRSDANGALTDGFDAAANLLKALANPHRIRIVDLLADDALCVGDLVERLGVDQPLVSQHLRRLRDAGLIVGTRRGREIEYSLADHHIAHIVRDAIVHAAEPTDGPGATGLAPDDITTPH